MPPEAINPAPMPHHPQMGSSHIGGKPPKRDLTFWENQVATSNGGRMMMPKKLAERLKEITESDAKKQKIIVELAHQTAIDENKMNQIWFEFKQWASENGMPDVWAKDMGFEQEALKDGFPVVNFIDKK